MSSLIRANARISRSDTPKNSSASKRLMPRGTRPCCNIPRTRTPTRRRTARESRIDTETSRSGHSSLALNRCEIVDEPADELVDALASCRVRSIYGVEVPAPDRHLARAVHARQVLPVDRRAHAFGGERAAVARCDPRQVRNRLLQRLRHDAVAARLPAVAARAEYAEQLRARHVGRFIGMSVGPTKAERCNQPIAAKADQANGKSSHVGSAQTTIPLSSHRTMLR